GLHYSIMSLSGKELQTKLLVFFNARDYNACNGITTLLQEQQHRSRRIRIWSRMNSKNMWRLQKDWPMELYSNLEIYLGISENSIVSSCKLLANTGKIPEISRMFHKRWKEEVREGYSRVYVNTTLRRVIIQFP